MGVRSEIRYNLNVVISFTDLIISEEYFSDSVVSFIERIVQIIRGVHSLEHKGLKSVTNLLSKTAGLIFFSFLAISLGVVFGLLFEGWVKDPAGAPVGSETSALKPVDLSNDIDLDSQVTEDPNFNTTETAIPITPPVIVKYKVRVGPYSQRNDALAASKQLESLGYPVYVGKNPPFAVQVGAFGSQTNAERLKSELDVKGYKAFIEQE